MDHTPTQQEWFSIILCLITNVYVELELYMVFEPTVLTLP